MAKFKELAKAKIQPTRNVIISQHTNGSFTMAQQLEVMEGKKLTTMFLKESIHIEGIQGLYELRDACNAAIHKVEDQNKN